MPGATANLRASSSPTGSTGSSTSKMTDTSSCRRKTWRISASRYRATHLLMIRDLAHVAAARQSVEAGVVPSCCARVTPAAAAHSQPTHLASTARLGSDAVTAPPYSSRVELMLGVERGHAEVEGRKSRNASWTARACSREPRRSRIDPRWGLMSVHVRTRGECRMSVDLDGRARSSQHDEHCSGPGAGRAVCLVTGSIDRRPPGAIEERPSRSVQPA